MTSKVNGFSMAMSLLWSLMLLTMAVIGTIAFATSNWVIAKDADAAQFNLKEISLGLVHACFRELDDTLSCGRYGECVCVCVCVCACT